MQYTVEDQHGPENERLRDKSNEEGNTATSSHKDNFTKLSLQYTKLVPSETSQNQGGSMRRVSVILASFAAVLVWAIPAVAGPFTDVPTHHWAYDAVDKLQTEGFVEGYPDGTFRGNHAFTRYEMAMVVARIWDAIEKKMAEISISGDRGEGITEQELQDELALVYNLMDEFKAELQNIGLRVGDIEKRMTSLEGRVSNIEGMLDTIKFSGALRVRIEDIITNDYAPTGFTSPTQYSGVIIGTPGSNVGEYFEVEEMIKLALEASPSDYIDVYLDLWQIASYLDAPKGNEYPPNQALIVDEAWAKADMMKLMGWTPSSFFNRFNLVIGRQYARFGEFGLAFDNYFETRPGISIVVGGDMLELASFLARSSRYGQQEGLAVGRASVKFGASRSEVEPRDYFAQIGVNYLGTGVGNEQGMGVDLNTELLSADYLNKLRVEYFQLIKDQSGYDVSKNFGDDFESSLIAWVDLYNDGNTRVSAAYANIGLVPGFSSIDNNPFEEYDAYYTDIGKNINYAYDSGLNPFPCDFVGGAMQLEHTWWDVLKTQLTFFDGTNQAEEDLPVVIRLNVRYPLSDASDVALEYIHSGIDALSLAKLRGEFLVRF